MDAENEAGCLIRALLRKLIGRACPSKEPHSILLSSRSSLEVGHAVATLLTLAVKGMAGRVTYSTQKMGQSSCMRIFFSVGPFAHFVWRRGRRKDTHLEKKKKIGKGFFSTAATEALDLEQGEEEEDDKQRAKMDISYFIL